MRIAGIIFLAILLAACRGESKPAGDAELSGGPAVAEAPDLRVGRAVAPAPDSEAAYSATSGSWSLSAKLEFVRWNVQERRLFVDFILKNTGSRNVSVWEASNSWGYSNWSIELRNDAKDIIEFGADRLRVWTENGPSTFGLGPGEVFRRRTYLLLKKFDYKDLPPIDFLAPLKLNGILLEEGYALAGLELNSQERSKWNAFFSGNHYEMRGTYQNLEATSGFRDWDEMQSNAVWTGRIVSDWSGIELTDAATSATRKLAADSSNPADPARGSI